MEGVESNLGTAIRTIVVLVMAWFSVVFSIDKLSILVIIVFSYLFLKEKLTIKAAIGLALIKLQ